jgi:hypothetical protein
MIGATTSEETADVEPLWHIPITLVGSHFFQRAMLNEDIQNPMPLIVLQLQGTISSACSSPLGTIKSALVGYSLANMDVVKSEEEKPKE